MIKLNNTRRADSGNEIIDKNIKNLSNSKFITKSYKSNLVKFKKLDLKKLDFIKLNFSEIDSLTLEVKKTFIYL